MAKIIHWTSPKNAQSILKDKFIKSKVVLSKKGKLVSSNYSYSNNDSESNKIYLTTCTDLNDTQIGFVFDSAKIKATEYATGSDGSNYYVLDRLNLELLEEIVYFELFPRKELGQALIVAKEFTGKIRKIQPNTQTFSHTLCDPSIPKSMREIW